MFLHQEVLHIAFNMLGLWWLGGPLEAALGRVRYLALYLLSGLAGSALTYLDRRAERRPRSAPPAPIFGLLGATAVLMRRMNYDMRPVDRAARAEPGLHLHLERHRLAGARRRSGRPGR